MRQLYGWETIDLQYCRKIQIRNVLYIYMYPQEISFGGGGKFDIYCSEVSITSMMHDQPPQIHDNISLLWYITH